MSPYLYDMLYASEIGKALLFHSFFKSLTFVVQGKRLTQISVGLLFCR